MMGVGLDGTGQIVRLVGGLLGHLAGLVPADIPGEGQADGGVVVA